MTRFPFQLTDFYMIRDFTDRYFLTDYSYILENHFHFVNESDYCFKPSLSRIFSINNSVKVLSPLSPQYEGPSTYLFRSSSLWTFIIYRNNQIGLVAKLFLKWVATCAQRSKVFSSSPAATYVQRWALCRNRPANV